MNKKSLTETDIRTKFITPALTGANGDKWDVMTQIREECYFTKGRVMVRGKTVKRGVAKKADYLLDYRPNLILAVLEAKDNNHAVGAGMQQALEYAEILDIPFAYSSNGDAFLEHDRTATSGIVTREIPLDQFPSPEELWSRYCAAKGFTSEQMGLATQVYYKVIRIGLNKDLDGWRPEDGQRDKYGQLIEDREYNLRDFDRNLILEKRAAVVAAKVTEFLKATDRFAKTIIFCENIDHAERMRQAMVNANPDLAAANPRYVMRITGDNDEGKAQLDNFIDPEQAYPVIAVTSRLMSTGVDAQTCKLIVLDRRIASMTEFKQIIGRGTRINEDYDKFFFTIMDFRQATALFADPAFDGDPVQIYEPAADDPVLPPEDSPGGGEGDETSAGSDGDSPFGGETGTVGEPPARYYVDKVEVRVATERVQYLDESGRLITESLRDYSRKAVLSEYASLDDFLTVWNDAERKQVILEELAEKGIFLDELAELVGRDYDAFDLVCHVAFDQAPLTRRERAEKVRKRNVFAKYGDQTRAVLDALLQKYADSGITSVESMDILKVDPLTAFGTPMEIIKLFGDKESYLAAIRELEQALYHEAA